MSLFLNQFGILKPLNKLTKNGTPFFRKLITKELTNHNNELIICKKIKSTASPILLKIYDVREDECEELDIVGYVDEEILETKFCNRSFFEKDGYVDLVENLNELHKLGIVYLDFKKDNIGYSKLDGRFKFFDFDFSGIVKPNLPNQWLYPPNEGYNLRDALLNTKEGKVVNYFDLDDEIFYNFMDELSKNQ